MGCACPRCQSRSFSVKSQSHYDIPKTQTAVVFEKNNAPLQVRKDWPVTQPEGLKPGEVLVRLAYSGVCHTDLHTSRLTTNYLWSVVTKVPDTLLQLETTPTPVSRLATLCQVLANSCLGCEDCRKGHESTCVDGDLHGFTVDGSFEQWCVSFSDHMTPIPKDLPMHAAAPILRAGVTVYKALKEIGGNCGDFVVIPGAGDGLGHLACQCARAMGYRVIAIDSGEDKRKLVASYGIKNFIDFKVGNVQQKVFEASEGRGAHATVVVASGGEVYKAALSFLRPHGAVMLVGLPKDTYITAEVFGSAFNAHRIIGSYVGNRQDSIEALKLAAARDVSTTYKIEKLEKLPDVFERMANGKLAGRIVLDCE
ncbi:LOW QUALITY PROTEIN: Alcohol dehydrogenase [Phytophthora megakarya]|uniref:alcohol dehydrogenase n=1 Tax=Phytophthora megakarya TaxID=4795 RepID=A0A225V0R1_9STRA|nr:LOW QUALITY PROTEIN: Alcohol dehydrogenase [Phytophthora megakarya]